MKILMIGNDKSVHGGITSVISQMLKFNWSEKNITMNFIPSYKGGNHLDKVTYFFKQLNKIKKYIKKEKPDIVHMHMSHTGSFTRANIIQKICLKYNVKTIVHLHGSEFKKFYNECQPKKQNEISEFFENTSCTIVLGQNWKEFIKSIAPKTRIEVFNNSVYVPKDYIVQQQPNNINFLYMGVLIKRKGVVDFLKAFNNVIKNAGFSNYNISFNIGGVGDEFETLKKYVEENKLSQNVKFLGWIEGKQKEEILKNNHVFVLPSYNEGLPIAILEALGYGMPIITTNVGSIEEAVHNEENGYLVRPGNVEEYTNKIESIIKNFETRKKMGEESKRIAIQYFDEKKYYMQLTNLYEKI